MQRAVVKVKLINSAARMKNKIKRAEQSRKLQGRDQDPSYSTSSKGIGLYQRASSPPKLPLKSPIHDIPISQNTQETQLQMVRQQLPILPRSSPISLPLQPSYQDPLHSTVDFHSSDLTSPTLFKPESTRDMLLTQTQSLQAPIAIPAVSVILAILFALRKVSTHGLKKSSSVRKLG